jgi:CDP-paratose 2-epimerase
VDQGVIALWVMAHHFQRSLSYIGYGGTGKQVRDALHIADLCDLMVRQVREFDAWEGWSGNVAGGLDRSVSLRELTALCEQVTGNQISIASVAENRPSDLRIFLGDCSLLFARTDWRPARSVADIVADTHTWVKSQEASLASGF